MYPPTALPTGPYQPETLADRWRPWWDSLALNPPEPSLSAETLARLWRALKFVLMHIEPWRPSPWEPESLKLAPADRWLMERFDALLDGVSGSSEDQAAQVASLDAWVSCVWCRWYIELSKPVLYETEALAPLNGDLASSRAVMAHATGRLMRLIAPFAPALAEAIWHNLPEVCRVPCASVLQAGFPDPMGGARFQADSEAMEVAIEVLAALLGVRREAGLGQLEALPQVLAHVDAQQRSVLRDLLPYIHSIVRPGELVLVDGEPQATPEGGRRVVTSSGVVLVVELVQLEAIARDMARVRRELGEVAEAMRYVANRLENPLFVERAPSEVVASERVRYQTLEERAEGLKDELENLAQRSKRSSSNV